MGYSLTVSPLIPTTPKLSTSFCDDNFHQVIIRRSKNHHQLFSSKSKKKTNHAIVPVARLFGPAIFEASKLKVLFLGVDERKHPGNLPRTYTLTHSDVTSKLTLAISQTINNSQLQGWYNKLQRDEVVAEWKKVKGKMALHVHCHISGGHFLLDLFSRLRYFIFCKELPVVLMAFVHGDENLLRNYPELQEALVWVYFHSNVPEFNKVECWGPLKDAASGANNLWAQGKKKQPKEATPISQWDLPQRCHDECNCCFPPITTVSYSSHWSNNYSVELPSGTLIGDSDDGEASGTHQVCPGRTSSQRHVISS